MPLSFALPGFAPAQPSAQPPAQLSIEPNATEFAQELQRRRHDGIAMFRAISPDIAPGYPDQVAFFKGDWRECLLRGGNRSGKTTAGAVYTAAVARGVPVYSYSGEEIQVRRPHQQGRNLLIWCHDEETEVLTDAGWKKFADLQGPERLATVDLATDTIEYEKPSQLHRGEYDGEMVRIRGRNKLDMLVTPDHRMVVHPDPLGTGYEDESTVVFKPADSLAHKDRLKVSASNWKGEQPALPEFLDEIAPEKFVEWLGFYIAEGCCVHTDHDGNGGNGYKVSITQKKPHMIPYVVSLMESMPFSYYTSKPNGGFVITSKALWEYLEPLGNCYTKRVPQWVKDSPQEIIQAFLDGYLAGDGHTSEGGTTSATSASRGLIDDIQEMFIKTGKSGVIEVRPPSEYQIEGRSGMRQEHYTVRMWRRDRASLRTQGENGKKEFLASRVPYKGVVYCATVKNGTLVTRRNGKPIISGNCIGLKLDHIGQTLHRMLFRAGAYKIIRDLETGLFRAWRPWDPEDVARANECKDSPPLIPASEILDSSWAWENKAQRVFSQVTLKNGTVICAYASSGEVKQGDMVDHILIDEKIKYSSHYPEWQMRTPDVRGNILWTSMTRGEIPAMVRITERAKEQAEEVKMGVRDRADVVEFQWQFSGNPFILESEKERIAESLDEDDLVQRDTGDYQLNETAIYPWFDKHLHAAIVDDPELEDEISRIFRASEGVAPSDWTHELILDPGTSKPAILIAAIPPQNLWHGGKPYYIPWDEIYIPRADASRLAKEVYLRQRRYSLQFERFIIDGHAARQTPMGFQGTIGQNYSRHFEALGVVCNATGPSFIPGNPDFANNSQVVSGWMVPQTNGLPRLRIGPRCRHLIWQLAHNQRHMDGDMPTDKPAKGQRDDLRQALEYWSSQSPRYVRPIASLPKIDEWAAHDAAFARRYLGGNEKREDGSVNFGPVRSLIT